MRVDVSPQRLSVAPGRPAVLTVTVTNTATIISSHIVRVLGVDRQWVALDQDDLSLFPDTSGVVVVTVTLPSGIPAGSRQLEVEVVEQTEPRRISRTRVELTVPAELHLNLALDPISSTGGRSTSVGVLVENTGNSVVDVDLGGRDEEGAVVFAFTPEVPTLAPGEQIVGTARLRAPRPWFGSHKVRSYTVEAGPKTAPVIAYGAWVQTPRLTRGKMALFGLLAAATVFAIVIAATLSGLGHKSNQDLALALQVAQASTEHQAGGASGIVGTVRQLSTHTGVSGVTVTLYQASDTSDALVSTATGSTGGYHFSGLAAGAYKVEYNGSGFTELWYPSSVGAADAQTVVLRPARTDSGIDVYLGGIPATISGQVVGGDPTGAILTLEVPPGASTGTAVTGTPRDATSAAAVADAADASGTSVPAVVTIETLDATGDFDLAGVPSPAVYDLVVAKTGYATTTQEVDLGGGENRTGLTLQLHKGDGSVTGRVESSGGGLNGATITASDATTTVSSLSLTKGGRSGTFVLDNLPTPDTLTLLVSHPGYASQTVSVSLAADQQLTGLVVTLASGVGEISGTVDTPAGTPKGGVTVVASDGNLSKTTVTLSTGKVGSYRLTGLPVPGAYTITFSRADLENQTRAEALGSTRPDVSGVNATLTLDSATLLGTVSQQGTGPVGGVTVTVDSGTTSYTVTTATNQGPGTKVGSYEINGITPGTYTLSFSVPGILPDSSVVDLTAGDVDRASPTLQRSAAITGSVVFAGTDIPAAGAEVRLYLTSQYPSVTSETITVGRSGTFDLSGVQAPESYIVGVSYPTGTPDQETVQVTTVPQQSVVACQSAASGEATTTTVPAGNGKARTSASTRSGAVGPGRQRRRARPPRPPSRRAPSRSRPRDVARAVHGTDPRVTVEPPVVPCADLWVPGIELAPGSVGIVTVQLRNRLDVPAHFALELAGVESQWVSGPAVIGPVAPGGVAAAELRLCLPVGYPAATLLASISARAVDSGAATVPATADLVLTVGDGSAIGAALDPGEVRGVHGGRFDVVLRNSGKTPIRVDLRAELPDDDMRVRFSEDAPVLQPGRELRVKARIRAARPVLGPVQRRHFAVRVQGRTTPVVLEGSLRQRPVLSPWWIKAVALLAVVALWASVAVVGISALSRHVKRSATARAIAGAPPLTPNHNPSGAAGGAGGANGSKGGSGGASPGGGGGGAGGKGSGGSGTDRVGGRVTASQAGGVHVTVAPTSLVAAAAEGARTAGGQIVTTASVTGAPTASTPIPDGKVYASEAGASLDPDLTAARSPTLGTTTTPDGTWAVAGLTAPGTYLVTFSKAGYGTEKYIVSATTAGSTITLNTSLVAGNGAISGRVLGPAGPLGGVQVAITDGTIKIDTRTPSVGAGVGTWSATGLTTPGTYLITATDPGYGTQTAVVTLGPGDRAGNIVLRMSSGTGDITGTVSSSAGPLGGITVTASGGDSSVTTTTSTSDPVGSYTLPDLPVPGTYALTVSGIGWVTQTQRVNLPDTRPVDAELQAATGDVNGIITVGADDARPSGVGLILSDQTTSYKTLTADGGGYEFQDIPPGSYLLTAEYYGDQTRSAEVTVRAGAAPVVVDLHLPPDASGSNGQGSIQGLAVDLFSNSPAIGVSVELDGVPVHYEHQPVLTSNAGTYTIRGVSPGEHLVTLVDHHITKVAGAPQDSPDLETESVDVDVPLNGVAVAPTVDMPKLDFYKGTVLSAATILPVDGATVTLLTTGRDKAPVPGVAPSTTGASGAFHLTGIPAGNYLVEVTGPTNADESGDYEPETFPLTMSPDVDLQQQTIDLTLLPSFQVVTEQVNPAGTTFDPVTGVCVTLQDNATKTLVSQYTGQYPPAEAGAAPADAGELYFAPLTAGVSYTAFYAQYPDGRCPAAATTVAPPGDPTANPTTFVAVADNTAITRPFITANVQAITLQLQYAAELDTTTSGPGGTTVAAFDDCPVSPSVVSGGACSPYTGAPLTATLTGVASFDASGNPVTTTVTGTQPPGAETYMFSAGDLSSFIGSTATLTVAGSPETFADYTQTVDLHTTSVNIDALLTAQPVPVTGTGTPPSGLSITTEPSTVTVDEGPGGALVWSDPASTVSGAAVPGLYQLTFAAHDYEPPPSGPTSTFTIPLCASSGCAYPLADTLVYQPSVTITPSAVTSPATVTLYYDGAVCGATVGVVVSDCPGMTDADSPITLPAGSSAGPPSPVFHRRNSRPQTPRATPATPSRSSRMATSRSTASVIQAAPTTTSRISRRTCS